MATRQRAKIALVVDDEVFARLFAAQVLQDEGFETFEAESAVEALGVLNSTDGVSLLITDVAMPGDRDGLALARKVAQAHPEVGIVIVSGVVQPTSDETPPQSKFLSKPYTAHTLASLIRELS